MTPSSNRFFWSSWPFAKYSSDQPCGLPCRKLRRDFSRPSGHQLAAIALAFQIRPPLGQPAVRMKRLLPARQHAVGKMRAVADLATLVKAQVLAIGGLARLVAHFTTQLAIRMIMAVQAIELALAVSLAALHRTVCMVFDVHAVEIALPVALFQQGWPAIGEIHAALIGVAGDATSASSSQASMCSLPGGCAKYSCQCQAWRAASWRSGARCSYTAAAGATGW